jgi:hypothetical protein
MHPATPGWYVNVARLPAFVGVHGAVGDAAPVDRADVLAGGATDRFESVVGVRPDVRGAGGGVEAVGDPHDCTSVPVVAVAGGVREVGHRLRDGGVDVVGDEHLPAVVRFDAVEGTPPGRNRSRRRASS